MVKLEDETEKVLDTLEQVPEEVWANFGNGLLELTTLTVVTAVFIAMVDDVRASRLELRVEGDDPMRFETRSFRNTMSRSRQLAEGLAGTPALAGASARAITRGSPEAMSWFQEWAAVYLQMLCRSMTYTSETLQPGNWEHLRICLQFKHRNGKRTVLTSCEDGTFLICR